MGGGAGLTAKPTTTKEHERIRSTDSGRAGSGSGPGPLQGISTHLGNPPGRGHGYLQPELNRRRTVSGGESSHPYDFTQSQ